MVSCLALALAVSNAATAADNMNMVPTAPAAPQSSSTALTLSRTLNQRRLTPRLLIKRKIKQLKNVNKSPLRP